MQLEKLTFVELETLLGWAREEGWNPGLHDAEVFWNTDPGAFWGYRHDGELIAGGSLVSYEGRFGFMGLFIVHPDHRSGGVGRSLWYQRRDKLISRLDEGASIGMDGVLAMQPFYAAGGFTIAYRDERHELEGRRCETDPSITDITPADFDSIAAFDETCFGFERSRFLRPWLQMPDSRAFKYDSGNGIEGFAVLRKCHSGFKVGPLFADRPKVAEEIYKACLHAVPGEPVFLDIPMANPKAVDLTEKFETRYVFECARMYYGPAPDMALDRVFGITTFELG